MTAEQVRIGLVGYGFGGRYFHAPLLASAPGCDFAGVVTTSAARRAELAREHPGVRAYDSLEALAADGVSAVAISTPAHTHAPVALQAIGLGMAVVCDKPFALTSADARQVIAEAETAGVALSVYQNRRWDSDLLTLQKLIAQGRLGEIQRFESAFERFEPASGPPRGRRGDPARLRQPPGRPGAAALRAGHVRPRRDAPHGRRAHRLLPLPAPSQRHAEPSQR